VHERLFDIAPFHLQIEAAWHHSVWGAGGREDLRVRPTRADRTGSFRRPTGHDRQGENGAGGVHPRRGQQLGGQEPRPSDRPTEVIQRRRPEFFRFHSPTSISAQSLHTTSYARGVCRSESARACRSTETLGARSCRAELLLLR
jgi:hypothetical protein